MHTVGWGKPETKDRWRRPDSVPTSPTFTLCPDATPALTALPALLLVGNYPSSKARPEHLKTSVISSARCVPSLPSTFYFIIFFLFLCVCNLGCSTLSHSHICAHLTSGMQHQLFVERGLPWPRLQCHHHHLPLDEHCRLVTGHGVMVVKSLSHVGIV